MSLVLLALSVLGSSPYVSPEAALSVAFPVEPITKVNVAETAEGPQTQYILMASHAGMAYFIVVACTPPPTMPSDPVAVLDYSRQLAKENLGEEPLREKRLQVSGYEAARGVESLSGQIGHTLVVVGPRGAVYSAVVSVTSEEEATAADAFLDSLKILEPTDLFVCGGE